MKGLLGILQKADKKESSLSSKYRIKVSENHEKKSESQPPLNNSGIQLNRSIQKNSNGKRRDSLDHQRDQIDWVRMKYYASEQGQRKENTWERLYRSPKKTKIPVVEKEPKFLTKMKTDFEKIMNSQSTNNSEEAQKLRMYEFIFQKKKQAKLKYDNTTESTNDYALPVPKGSQSIMLNQGKKNYTLGLVNTNEKKRISLKHHFNKKWKTVKWLMENQKEPMCQLIKSYNEHYNRFFKKSYEENSDQSHDSLHEIFKLDQQEFTHLQSYSGIGGNADLIEKQFNTFDYKKSGYISYIEFQVSFEIFKESPYDQKVQLFVDLADQANTGYVNLKNLYDVLKIICKMTEEKVKLKKSLREVAENLHYCSCDKIDKKAFYDYSKEFIPQKNLLYESIRQIHKVNKLIENDVQDHFQNWVPLTNKIVKLKEGYHFPMMDSIIKIATDAEEAEMQKNARMKKKVDIPGKQMLEKEGN